MRWLAYVPHAFRMPLLGVWFFCASLAAAIGLYTLFDIYVFRLDYRPEAPLFSGVGLLVGVTLVVAGARFVDATRDDPDECIRVAGWPPSALRKYFRFCMYCGLMFPWVVRLILHKLGMF